MPPTVNQNPSRKVDSLWQRGLRLLLPPRCLLCGEDGASGIDLCQACQDELPWNRHACPRCALPLPVSHDRCKPCGDCLRTAPAFAQAHAAFVYTAPMDQLLPRFKFHADLAAGKVLSGLLASSVANATRPLAVLPVPLHRARLRQRGYDQALELARPLAATLRLPLLTQGLVRQRATVAQSELDARARRGNVRGAFAWCGPPPPAHVALVDDVMTTGSTADAAARTLLAAGAQRVDVWVVARVA